MSLFRGLITINVGDSLDPEAGIAAIKQALQRSHKAQFYDLPKRFIDEFRPYLDGLRVQLFLPAGVNKPDWLATEIECLPSRVQAEYYGRNMYVGGINLASQTFDILWSRGKVYDISRVRQDKCLRCSIRREIRHLDDRPSVRMGSVISQDTHDEFISTELNYSDKGIIANIPPTIIEKFLPLIRKQNFRLLLPTKTDFRPNLATKGGVRSLPGLVKVQSEVYGRKINCGGICLPHIHLGIAWDESGIVSLRTFEWPECIDCLMHTYNNAWHLSRRFW